MLVMQAHNQPRQAGLTLVHTGCSFWFLIISLLLFNMKQISQSN